MSGRTRTASVGRTMSQRSPQGRGPRPDAAEASRTGGGMDEGMRVLSYLIAGLVAYGFLGWLGDHYFGTRWMLPTGMLVGMAASVYLIIRRYSQAEEAQADQARAQQDTAETPTTGGAR